MKIKSLYFMLCFQLLIGAGSAVCQYTTISFDEFENRMIQVQELAISTDTVFNIEYLSYRQQNDISPVERIEGYYGLVNGSPIISLNGIKTVIGIDNIWLTIDSAENQLYISLNRSGAITFLDKIESLGNWERNVESVGHRRVEGIDKYEIDFKGGKQIDKMYFSVDEFGFPLLMDIIYSSRPEKPYSRTSDHYQPRLRIQYSPSEKKVSEIVPLFKPVHFFVELESGDLITSDKYSTFSITDFRYSSN